MEASLQSQRLENDLAYTSCSISVCRKEEECILWKDGGGNTAPSRGSVDIEPRILPFRLIIDED